jgi:hypothetical protein
VGVDETGIKTNMGMAEPATRTTNLGLDEKTHTLNHHVPYQSGK